MATLQRSEQDWAWEFRTHWASQKSVTVTLESPPAVLRTVTGKVSAVAVTGSFATVDGWHIPMYAVEGLKTTLVTDEGFQERGETPVPDIVGQLNMCD